ncbi:gluconate 2-dehydrogenase subunit 3 family protein [Marinobacterium arenosum]|uniref:gluconate 2-dehydrogenase subunit 3 family protein n=1 Tax=Marinobacterium arenosum TaxID=2862496 RepID=UPI001C963F42|nr:gluconate 2-dehydrogenase subunit 3 family protein [Marinobacterium arenosum]MBY4675021.1 twin-arginine translocation signal domain-containing protein [Marinobacterium arenosum]
MNKNNTAESIPNPSRRRFLARSGAAAVCAGALSAGLLSATAWAAKAVGEQASATLLRMARDIYPHDTLEDKYYSQVLTPLAKKAEQDAALQTLLKEGVAELDKRSHQRFGKPYLEVAVESDRVQILRAIEDGAFFQRLKGDLMMGIYNNPELWPRFGYGGSAWQHGGYINRGYDQIDWV